MDGKKDPSKSPTVQNAKQPDFEVGYGSPPMRSRFKKGQSGNPRGRPRGSQNRPPSYERFTLIALEEAYREIVVRDGDDPVKLPSMRAIIRRVVLQAVNGDKRSQKMIIDLIGPIEHQKKVQHVRELEVAMAYKLDWEEELERRDRHGEIGEDPVPHPDDIVPNFANDRIEIRGPMTKEQNNYWEWVQLLHLDSKQEIADLEQEMKKNPKDPKLEERLLEAQHDYAWTLRMFEIKKGWNRRLLEKEKINRLTK